MRTPSSARVMVSPSWKRPPIAQPAAAPAPTSSVPTRMATLIKVAAFVQLIGAASAKALSPQDVREALADIPRRLAAQAGGWLLLQPEAGAVTAASAGEEAYCGGKQSQFHRQLLGFPL